MRWCLASVTAGSMSGWQSPGVFGRSAMWTWRITVVKVSRPGKSGKMSQTMPTQPDTRHFSICICVCTCVLVGFRNVTSRTSSSSKFESVLWPTWFIKDKLTQHALGIKEQWWWRTARLKTVCSSYNCRCVTKVSFVIYSGEKWFILCGRFIKTVLTWKFPLMFLKMGNI